MAEIVRLTTRQNRTERQLSAQLAEVMRSMPAELVAHLPRDMVEARSKLLHGLDLQIQPDSEQGLWPGGFTMISREYTAEVWDWIRTLPRADRPNQVRHAFDLVMLNLRWDTGEVMLTRDQLAEKIGCSADNLSRIMSKLESQGIIRRERQRIEGMRGRGKAVYFLNSNVGWMGTLEARHEVAKFDKPPTLKLVKSAI